MIKVENNKIIVTHEINVEEIKNAKKMFDFSVIGSTVLFIISVNIIIFCVLMFALIFDIIARIIIKIKHKEKIFLTLSPEELIINNKKICDTKDIINFGFYDSSEDFNEIFINYNNKKGKKRSKIIIFRGANKSEFTNIANNYIQSQYSTPGNTNCNKVQNNNTEFKKIDFKTLKSEKTIDAVFIGKTKDFIKQGAQTSFKSENSKFVFITPKNEILSIEREYINNINTEIFKDSRFFKITYNEKYQDYIIEKTDSFEIDINKISEYKNDFINQCEILFYDNPEIFKEIELENNLKRKMFFMRKIAFITLIISALIFTFQTLILKKTFHEIENLLGFSMVALFIIFMAFSIVILIEINKYRKKYLKY